MKDERQILELLADGGFHSGQDLAAELGISRSAVWKRLQHLQEALGIEVFAVSGKGYKLAKPLQLLDPDRLQKGFHGLDKGTPLPVLEVHLSLGSTNHRALDLAKQTPQVPRLIIAERQTEGRGRRGRQWISPLGGNLYLSLYWWFDAMPEALGKLSLLMAVCLARCLEAHGVPKCELKWPNDVRYHGKKLAGILLEMQGEAGGGCGVVIGMGVNLDMQGTSVEAIDQPWTDVRAITGNAVDRNMFVTKLATDMLLMINDDAQNSPDTWLKEWQARDVLQGKRVKLELASETINGVAMGIDAQGALLLERDGQLQRFFSGEVSVRLAD